MAAAQQLARPTDPSASRAEQPPAKSSRICLIFIISRLIRLAFDWSKKIAPEVRSAQITNRLGKPLARNAANQVMLATFPTKCEVEGKPVFIALSVETDNRLGPQGEKGSFQ